MRFTTPSNAKHPLAVRFFELEREASNAISAQWAALEDGMEAFAIAHDAAKAVCAAKHAAEQACYDAGLAIAPYWHVTPKQMASYAR